MKFTAFFWDFDGTLFDSYPRICRAFSKGLATCGISASPQELLPLVKVSLSHAARVFATARCPQQDIMAAYRAQAEAEGMETMPPYPGAKAILARVVQLGGQNFLYTHRGESAFGALAHYGMETLFADSVTSRDGFAHKPAPDALLHLIRKHSLSAGDCLMVGDRDIDLLAGRNAGMAGALFDPDGFYPHFDTPFRYASLTDMRRALVEGEGRCQPDSD